PLVREMLAYASGGQHDQWQQLVGKPLSGSIGGSAASGSGNGQLHIVRPDGREAPVALRSTPTGWEGSYDETDVSGIYSLRGLPSSDVSSGRNQAFAINVDTAESDLAKIDPRQLPSAIAVRSTWQSDTNASSLSATSESPWSQSILWIVIALMF